MYEYFENPVFLKLINISGEQELNFYFDKKGNAT